MHRFFLFCVGVSLCFVGCPKQSLVPETKEIESIQSIGHYGWFDRSAYKIIRAGKNNPTRVVSYCIQKFETSDEHAGCLLKYFRNRKQAERIAILHQLFQKKNLGKAAFMVMLQQAEFPLKVMLADHLLVYVAHTSFFPRNYLKNYFLSEKQAFFKSFSLMGRKTKLLAAGKLTASMNLFESKEVFEFLGGHLRFPASFIWQHLLHAKSLQHFLVFSRFKECTVGRYNIPENVEKAVQWINHYHMLWEAWNYATVHSGAIEFFVTLREKYNESVLPTLPKIKRKMFAKALQLTRRLAQIQPHVAKQISKIQDKKLQKEFTKWFEEMKKKSPQTVL